MSGICGEAFLVLAPFTETDKTTIYGRNALCQPSDDPTVSEVLYYPASAECGPVKVMRFSFSAYCSGLIDFSLSFPIVPHRDCSVTQLSLKELQLFL